MTRGARAGVDAAPLPTIMERVAPGSAADIEHPAEIDLRQLVGDPRPPAHIIRDWLPAGEVTLLAGHGGAGKSALALYLAVCVALGREWYGLPTARRRVLHLSAEDGVDVIHWRLSRVCAWLGVDLADLAGWLRVIDASHADVELTDETRDGPVMTSRYAWLRDQMRDAQVLVIDGASDTHGGSEIVRRHVRMYVRALRRLVPADGAVLVLAHVAAHVARSPETSEGYSGSTAWNNSVRARWYVRRDDDADELILSAPKTNHAGAVGDIRLRWSEAAHLFLAVVSPAAGHIDRALAEGDEREKVLAMIRAASAAGDPLPAATAGTRTAYSVAEARADFPAGLRSKAGRARFHRHVEALRAAGAVRVESQRYGTRNSREVLRAG